MKCVHKYDIIYLEILIKGGDTLKQNYKRVSVNPETYAMLEQKANECNIPYVSRIVEILTLNFIDFIGHDGKIKFNIFDDPKYKLTEPMLEALIEKIKDGLKNDNM